MKRTLSIFVTLLLAAASMQLRAADKEIYAVIDKQNHKVTLRYDNQKEGHKSLWETWNSKEGTTQTKKSDRDEIHYVILDETMKDVRPRICKKWFADMRFLKKIDNLDYLYTREIVNMDSMFYNCQSLTSLDWSSLQYGVNMRRMRDVFANCSRLAVLDLSSFSINAPFLPEFKETNAQRMFADCTNLRVIFFKNTESDFSFGGYYDKREMTNCDDMFLNCKKLVGGNGTKYNSTHVNGMYGRVDKEGQPGYFTSADEAEKPSLYALLSADSTTLTIRYDKQLGPNRGIRDWSLFNNADDNPNKSLFAITGIVIDESVKDAQLESTEYMFANFKFLKEIKGLEYLNTSNVKRMGHMFEYDIALESLDLSSFNTSNVTDMGNMFNHCRLLKSLDVSSFNTTNVKNMTQMFSNCYKLTSLDLSNFTTVNVMFTTEMFCNDESLQSINLSTFLTTNVMDMSGMFKQCSSVKSLKLPGFNTKNVTNMSYMFAFCGVTSLDLTSFNFNKVTTTNSMFYGSANLQTIYCNADLNYAPKLEDSREMFALCLNLKGGAGTSLLNAEARDGSYAHADAADYPGFFTSTYETDYSELYGKRSPDGSTLTICYDKKRYIVGGVTDWSVYNNAETNEKAETNRITKVVIDETIQPIEFASTEGWFADFRYLRTITGLDHLNTSKVTTMRNMFARCDSLIDMSVSSFDTKNVTDMSGMFAGCGKLYKIDVSKFNTQNVTDMSYMFNGCKRLGAINVDNFDTRKVTNMSHMFSGCVYATPLNVKNFDTRNVTDMSYMFAGCKYETSLAVNNFNTENVTDMSGMFSECKQLRSLDMRSFDVSQVTDMSAMFRNDSALITLYANQDWNTSASLVSSENMFYGCPKLKGSAGTLYNEAYVDATYARPDGGSGNEGYFTAVAEIYATWDADNTTLTLRYDGNREDNGGVTDWAVYGTLATKVVLDASMKQAEPTSTKDWFRSFVQLETIEHLDYLKTYNVKDMSGMFAGCSSLTVLNVNGFSVSWVETAEGMFSYCLSLTTIWCDHNWNDNLYNKNTNNMFLGCTSLVGGKGTTYDANYTGSSRACTDSNLRYGYFTAMPTGGADLSGNELYAVLESDNKTLTIHYDKQRASLGGSIDWYKYSSTSGYHVTDVVFQKSVENAQPTTTEDWFRDFSDLEKITGIEYLNTEYVTTMSGMFKNCSSLTELDVTNFNTQNVTDMGFMFSDCSSLTALDVSGFDMRKVTIMYNMFENCESLTELDIKEFDTREVTDMTMLFAGCKNLTELDVTKLNTSKVEDMMGMFYQCQELTTIDVSNFKMENVRSVIGMFYDCWSLTTIWSNDDWSQLSLLTNYDEMFTNCTELVGGNGTSYSSNANDVTFAHVDAKGKPGYFTSNLTFKVSLTAENGKIEVEEKDIDLNAVPKGTELHLTAIPSNGFVLGSWTGYNGISLVVNEDTEVTANFIVQTFTVKFVDWDDKVIDQQIVDWGKAAVAPEAPIREDYRFIGWNPVEFSNIYSDMTIKAEYELAVYKVTLKAENGKITLDQDVDLANLPYGTILNLTAEPDYGYVFDHWGNYDPALGLAVSEDITITAYFKPATFTLTVAAEPKKGGTFKLGGVDENNQNTYMSEYTIEAIPNEGYEFVEWRDGGQVLDSKDTKISGMLYGDVSITGVFKAFTYTVIFQDYDGTELSKQTVDWGTAATAPEDPTHEGYKFTGWKPADFSSVKADMTITAQYESTTIYHTVTFLDYDGTELLKEQVEDGKDAKGPATNPTRDGYEFTGWSKPITNITADLTVLAQYEKIIVIVYYNVTFLGFNDVELKVESVEEGKSATAPEAPAVEGYEFKGWDKDFSNVKSNLTVKALYEEIVIDYSPQNLKAEVVTLEDKDQRITLSWDAVDGVPSYELQLFYNSLSLYQSNTFGKHEVSILLSELQNEVPELAPGTYQIDWQVRSTDALAQPISEWVAGKQFEVIVPMPTGLENVGTHPSPDAAKLLRNGRVYILRNGEIFTTDGQRVR